MSEPDSITMPQVEHQMTFSAHTDAKGVVDLVHQVQPRAAILVHGEVEKMKFLIQHLQMSFNIPCYCPATGESVHIQHAPVLPLTVSSACMDKALHECGAGLVRECIKVLPPLPIHPGRLQRLQLPCHCCHCQRIDA